MKKNKDRGFLLLISLFWGMALALCCLFITESQGAEMVASWEQTESACVDSWRLEIKDTDTGTIWPFVFERSQFSAEGVFETELTIDIPTDRPVNLTATMWAVNAKGSSGPSAAYLFAADLRSIPGEPFKVIIKIVEVN